MFSKIFQNLSENKNQCGQQCKEKYWEFFELPKQRIQMGVNIPVGEWMPLVLIIAFISQGDLPYQGVLRRMFLRKNWTIMSIGSDNNSMTRV